MITYVNKDRLQENVKVNITSINTMLRMVDFDPFVELRRAEEYIRDLSRCIYSSQITLMDKRLCEERIKKALTHLVDARECIKNEDAAGAMHNIIQSSTVINDIQSIIAEADYDKDSVNLYNVNQ